MSHLFFEELAIPRPDVDLEDGFARRSDRRPSIMPECRYGLPDAGTTRIGHGGWRERPSAVEPPQS
jgi:hypothetical protein